MLRRSQCPYARHRHRPTISPVCSGKSRTQISCVKAKNSRSQCRAVILPFLVGAQSSTDDFDLGRSRSRRPLRSAHQIGAPAPYGSGNSLMHRKNPSETAAAARCPRADHSAVSGLTAVRRGHEADLGAGDSIFQTYPISGPSRPLTFGRQDQAANLYRARRVLELPGTWKPRNFVPGRNTELSAIKTRIAGQLAGDEAGARAD